MEELIRTSNNLWKIEKDFEESGKDINQTSEKTNYMIIQTFTT